VLNRIDVVTNEVAGIAGFLARAAQGGIRVLAKRQQTLAVGKAELEAPMLGPCSSNEQEQTSTVVKLSIHGHAFTQRGLRAAHHNVGQGAKELYRHGGTKICTPKRIPKDLSCQETVCDDLKRQNPHEH
jgi:hypothetical protein